MSSPGFRVEDHEILFPLHHLRQILERHVGARAGVVEASIGVLLDDRRLGRLGHVVFRLAVARRSVSRTGASPSADLFQTGSTLQLLRTISQFRAPTPPFCLERTPTPAFGRTTNS